MHEQHDLRVKAKVERHSPRAAKGYYLQNALARVPSSGAYSLVPFQQPLNAPTGSYRVYYTLDVTDSSPMEQVPPGSLAPVIEIYDPTTFAGDQTSENPPAARPAKLPVRERWQDDPRHIDNQIEYQAETFANELTENKLLLGRKMREATEAVESFVLARAYRRELMTTAQQFSQFQQQQLQAFNQIVATNKELNERVQTQARLQTAPPAAGESFWGNLPAILAFGNTLARGFFGRDLSDDDESPVNATIADATTALQKEKRRLEAKLAAKKKKKAAHAQKRDQPEESESEGSGQEASDSKLETLAKREKKTKSLAASSKKTKATQKPSQTPPRPSKKKSKADTKETKGALTSGSKERGK